MLATFDPKKSHGLVYGMPGVQYQQDDNLFDISGKFVRPLAGETTPEEVESAAEDAQTQEVRDFLQLTLKEGPVLKTEIYKMAENFSYSWETVMTVAAELNIRKFNRKAQQYWDLNREA
jgi:hypothetical protein